MFFISEKSIEADRQQRAEMAATVAMVVAVFRKAKNRLQTDAGIGPADYNPHHLHNQPPWPQTWTFGYNGESKITINYLLEK